MAKVGDRANARDDPPEAKPRGHRARDIVWNHGCAATTATRGHAHRAATGTDLFDEGVARLGAARLSAGSTAARRRFTSRLRRIGRLRDYAASNDLFDE